MLLSSRPRVLSRDRGIAFIVNVVLAFINGWVLMLAVGVAHHWWWSAVPTIGYWSSVVFVVLLRSVFRVTTAREVAANREDGVS